MKKQLKVLALGLIYSVSVCAYALAEDHEQNVNKKDVPKVIVSSFEKIYPNAKVLNYTRENKKGKSVYEIESKDGNTKRDISYSATGQVLEIEEAISIKELPKNITQSLSKSYPKATIITAEKITKGNANNYEVEIKNNNKIKEIVFENGKVKKVKENEKYEKGEAKEKGEDKEKGE